MKGGEVNGIHCSPLTPKSDPFNPEGNKVAQAGFTLGTSMYLFLLFLPRNVSQEDSLHDFPMDQSGADQPVAPGIILMAF